MRIPWRVVVGLSLATSGACFLLGLGLLYHLEGPGAPGAGIELAKPSGQMLYTDCTAALAFASTFAVIAFFSLHSRLWTRSPYESGLAVVLTAVAGSFLLAVLSLQYGLTTVGQKAVVPSDRVFVRAQENAFQQLTIFEHGAADLGGYASFALLAASTCLTCVVLLRHRTWWAPAITGLLAAAALPALYLLNASYLFMLPFGLWELLLAGYVFVAAAAFAGSDRVNAKREVLDTVEDLPGRRA